MRHLAISLEEVHWHRTWEAYFAQQSQHLEASIVDFELRRTWKTGHAAPEGIEEVHHGLRHGYMVDGVGPWGEEGRVSERSIDATRYSMVFGFGTRICVVF